MARECSSIYKGVCTADDSECLVVEFKQWLASFNPGIRENKIFSNHWKFHLFVKFAGLMDFI
jgi:hypothetical protein